MRKTSVPSSSGGTLIPPAPPSHTEHDVAQMFADDYYCRKSDLHPWFVRGDPVLAEWGGQWHPDGGTYTICQRVDVGHDDSRSKIVQADLPSLRATVASTDREQPAAAATAAAAAAAAAAAGAAALAAPRPMKTMKKSHQTDKFTKINKTPAF